MSVIPFKSLASLARSALGQGSMESVDKIQVKKDFEIAPDESVRFHSLMALARCDSSDAPVNFKSKVKTKILEFMRKNSNEWIGATEIRDRLFPEKKSAGKWFINNVRKYCTELYEENYLIVWENRKRNAGDALQFAFFADD